VAGLCDIVKMRRGQISLEAVGAVAVILLIYASTIGYALHLQDAASDRMEATGRDNLCLGLAAVIDAVHFGGPGAHALYDVGGEFTVRPGLIELGTTEDSFYCTLERGAVNESQFLTKRRYELVNGGGYVLFR
jgi:hypothetical protein